jgi:hypothetical protein
MFMGALPHWEKRASQDSPALVIGQSARSSENRVTSPENPVFCGHDGLTY